MSWGGGREIFVRPCAAHACKTVLGAEAAVLLQCWRPGLAVAGVGSGHVGRQLTSLLAAFYGLSRRLRARALSAFVLLWTARPRTDFSHADGSTRATSNLPCDDC